MGLFDHVYHVIGSEQTPASFCFCLLLFSFTLFVSLFYFTYFHFNLNHKIVFTFSLFAICFLNVH